MTAAQIVASLPGRKIKTPTGWKVQCLVHEDHTPSLHISESRESGRVIVHCFGCGQDGQVIRALFDLGLWKGAAGQLDDKAIADRRQEAEELQAQERLVALRKTRYFWAKSVPAEQHDYLQRKGIKPHGLRIDQYGNLLVPMHDSNGHLCNLQRITPSGEKHFVKHAQVLSVMYVIGEIKDRVVIVEGFATGATVYEAAGTPVVVAFNAGNLIHVAQAVRAKHPDASIVVAGDNDHTKQVNGGLQKASEAAKSVNGKVLLPYFSANEDGTDWNDYAKIHGFMRARQSMLKELPARSRAMGLSR